MNFGFPFSKININFRRKSIDFVFCFLYDIERYLLFTEAYMKKTGFDNDKYLKMQSEKIRERIRSFGGKLYLEFGGKLFDDYHASRVREFDS